MKKYTPPSYPSKNQDAINNNIMETFNKLKKGGARVELVSLYNKANVPSVISDIKNLGKSNK